MSNAAIVEIVRQHAIRLDGEVDVADVAVVQALSGE